QGMLVHQFGAFAAALQYDQLPSEAVHRAKQIVLDTLGTTLGGYRAGFGRQVVDFTARTAPGAEATMIADGRRVSVEGAAFANATMAKMLGMDDSHRAYGHVAAEVVPAALATVEATRGDGRDLIVAMAAAYEVFGRVGRQVRRTQLERGYDIKGMVGALACAVAAGRGLGLGAEEIAHALALSTALAGGLETYVHDPANSHTKDLISGFAARNGVFAALLARAGFRGPRGALEGEGGFGRAFGEGIDPGEALADLGRAFEIAVAGFKPHAGCRHVHQGVDAAREVRRQIEVDPARVTQIEVATYRHAIDAPFRTTLTPESPSAAGYSLPTAVAVGLVFGSFYPEDIARFTDPRVQALLPRMHLSIDPAIQAAYPERNGCVVRVTLDDGRTVEGRVEYAKGEPENMLTDEEFEAKFRRTVADLLPASQTDDLIARVWNLDRIGEVESLVRLTATPT
ncbi:MAG: MmgE/PrpD family protein, partial [Armatimonadota bacterium]|nr:MmgE/PrpD family protein [Armatimonadota bacterium]